MLEKSSEFWHLLFRFRRHLVICEQYNDDDGMGKLLWKKGRPNMENERKLIPASVVSESLVFMLLSIGMHFAPWWSIFHIKNTCLTDTMQRFFYNK